MNVLPLRRGSGLIVRRRFLAFEVRGGLSSPGLEPARYDALFSEGTGGSGLASNWRAG